MTTKQTITPSGQPIFRRRALLHALGVGAASSLALPLGGRSAAAAGTIPTRLVIFSGDGMIYDDCWPRGATETSWDFGEVHAPLAPYKARSLVIDGLGMVSEEIDSGPKGNAHQQGLKHVLAAANTSRGDLPGGPTIDQFIAAKLNSPNPITKLRTLNVAISSWAGDLSPILATDANTPVQPLWDPRQIYTKLFADFTPPASPSAAPSTMTVPAAPSAAELARARQLAALGFAHDELGAFGQRLGQDDRARLDAHLSLVTDLQKRMQLATPGGGTSGGGGPVVMGPSCAKPASPAGVASCNFSCYNATDLRASNFELGRDLNTKLAAMALACDLTRVVTFQTSYGPDSLYGYSPGAFGSTDMHDLIHKVCDSNNALSRNADARKVVKNQNLVEAKVVAAMCKALDELPTPDGKTLLDHTIVLWAGHIGYGSHDLARLPWVIVGGGEAGFRTGRYVKLPPYAKSARGVPHNDLFVTIAQAMGVQTNSFGNSACCNGPIAKLRG